jgi:hypothetical protein
VDSLLPFFYLLGGSIFLSLLITAYFHFSERLIEQANESKLNDDPLSFLKNTQPWCVAAQAMLRFASA